ncbi:unnamed protein product [Ectocarpus sp. CCAP 1310/34]|nr:unnamed protein product [Ectocarpus sp. CCAP 1310/34]
MTGELTTLQQSRMILMLYFDLVKGVSSENRAKEQVRTKKHGCCVQSISI